MKDNNTIPAVSVIVPVYNPGPGIEKCLCSLQNQTLRDLEFIFIDDKGNDNSFEIIQKAAERDDRIKIIKNDQNSGPGISRNKGIDAAKGEYLGFVDSDDYVSNDFFELLYNKAVDKAAKIVRGNFCTVEYKDKRIDYSRGLAMQETIKEGIDENKPLYSLFLTPLWCAIFECEWIKENDIRFGTIRYSEDKVFLLQACYSAKTMEMVDEAMYCYVQNDKSLVHTISEIRLTDSLTGIREQLNYILREIGEADISVDYLIHLVEYPLILQTASARQEKLKNAADAFLHDLIEVISIFPKLEAVEKRFVVIQALLEYGCNISVGTYWDECTEDASVPYLDAMKRVREFASEHPERSDIYAELAKKAIRNGIEYSRSIRKTNREKRKAFQAEMKDILLSGSNSAQFILYYCDCMIHALGHRVKKRLGGRR